MNSTQITKAAAAARYWTLQERQTFAKQYPRSWSQIKLLLPPEPEAPPEPKEDFVSNDTLRKRVARLERRVSVLENLLRDAEVSLAVFKAQTDEAMTAHDVLLPHRVIMRAFCAGNEVFAGELCGSMRSARIAHIRHACCWFMRRYTELSLPGIGKLIGNRHHSTVMYGITNVNENMEKYRDIIHKAELWMEERALLPGAYKKIIDDETRVA